MSAARPIQQQQQQLNYSARDALHCSPGPKTDAASNPHSQVEEVLPVGLRPVYIYIYIIYVIQTSYDIHYLYKFMYVCIFVYMFL